MEAVAAGVHQGPLMDDVDKRLLDIIQTAFPLTPRPYLTLGEALGLTEAEALARVRRLKALKVIRRLGANFQSRALGFRSTLCAAKVPPAQLEDFIARVNALPGTTHNYLRQHDYNVWFTLIGPSWEDVCRTLDELSAATGLQILNLPAKKLFKIRVDFRMQEE
ncbi:MAG: AsnC family transcriptional regulator [Desulfovibrio sp.]|nr:AsnC family transcriptional regulator [Desulfovibrio sp.]